MAELARLKSTGSDVQVRDSYVEGFWVGLIGGITGLAAGYIGGTINPVIPLLEVLAGYGLVGVSLLGGFNNKLIVRHGIPFGASFAPASGVGGVLGIAVNTPPVDSATAALVESARREIDVLATKYAGH